MKEIQNELKLNLQLFGDGEDEFEDENLDDSQDDEDDDDLDEDDSDDDEDSGKEENKDDDSEDDDEYEKMLQDKEEFSTEGLDLEKLEGYTENKETYDAVAKMIIETGADKKTVVPLIKQFGTAIDNMEKEFNQPISKEKFKELDVEVRTGFAKINAELKNVLSKEEMNIFRNTFNSKEKIMIANKILGTATNKTGKADYSNGGRVAETSGTFDDFSKRYTKIISATVGNVEERNKRIKNLYSNYSDTSNTSIKEFIDENKI